MKTKEEILKEIIDRDFEDEATITGVEWKAICLIAMHEHEQERIKFISLNNLVSGELSALMKCILNVAGQDEYNEIAKEWNMNADNYR